jgi:hypothetical protein
MVIMTIPSKEKESQNCWEFMKCPKERREKCNIYKMDSGKECWFMSNLDNGANPLIVRGAFFYMLKQVKSRLVIGPFIFI